MDFFQGVVMDYLRANRACFVNSEYLIQLDPGRVYLKNRHWYCDAVVIDHQKREVRLVEITYNATLQTVVNRLKAWGMNWPLVQAAIRRDSSLQGDWSFCPQVFVPDSLVPLFERKLATLLPSWETLDGAMPGPDVVRLEEVLPWKYRSWDGTRYEDDAILKKADGAADAEGPVE